MEVKDLVGVAVAHRMFGKGIVEDAHDNYIEVFFSQKALRKVNFPIHPVFRDILHFWKKRRKQMWKQTLSYGE